MTRAGGETQQHRELKRLALVWAQAHGFGIVATEVRLPRSGFRADVAACRATRVGTDGAEPGESAVFECKQSRADLLRDAAPERATSERLREVAARRRELETMLGLHLPSLRRGESLFAECDSYDLDAVRHDGLRAVRREEATLLAKLYGGTKFARLRRYACADRFYLVVEPGVLEPHEAPEGWGLLERDGADLSLVRPPARVEPRAGMRVAMLQAVALAASRAVNAAAGVEPGAVAQLRRTALPG
jgi:hypothetical protein